MRTFDKSNALYERAIRFIPSGSQTFSKSAINVVQGASPLFFDHAEGARVWDPDGNSYLDYVLGLLPVILGYRDPDVDRAIVGQLERGITFSLATDLEIELAELLVELVPCAEMVRFAKNGSDATSAAIRLARAYTGRDIVAVCGYHGWHDWYIGTTSRDLGVPDPVKELSISFRFNDLDRLEYFLNGGSDSIAAVILEPCGFEEPASGFLEGLRELADKHGFLLIFDEIVSGFRIHIGGAQTFYGVTPDLACFGKSLGNGMPVSALVGRRVFMQKMNDIFFSGTFGGESLSLAAAIATIHKLQRENVIDRLRTLGSILTDAINIKLSTRKLDVRYSVGGPSWRPVISVHDADLEPGIAKSLLRQELTEYGIFQGAGINLCLAHDNPTLVQETLIAWDSALDAVASAFSGNDPESGLRGKPIQPIFQVR